MWHECAFYVEKNELFGINNQKKTRIIKKEETKNPKKINKTFPKTAELDIST